MSLLPRFTVCLTLPLMLLGAMTVQAADEQLYNQISLRAEAGEDVQQDRMSVTLYVENQDADPAKLAAGITRTINDAIEKARKVDGIQISSGQRNSSPIYENKSLKSSSDTQKLIGWRERAEIRLQSSDFAALSSLTGELLTTLNMGGIQFSIADETRLKHEDQLIKAAITQFKQRAQLITESLGGTGYKIVRMDLNSSGNFYPTAMPRAYAAAGSMKMDSAPIAVEAGTSRLAISADGQIEVLMAQ